MDELGFPDDASVSHTGGWLLIDPRSPIDVGGKTYAAGSYLAVDYDDVVKNGLKGAKCRALYGGAADAKQSAYVVALYQDFLFCALGGKRAGCGDP